MIARLHVVTDDEVLARPDVVDWSTRLIQAFAQDIALHIRGPRTPARRIYDIARNVYGAVGGESLVVNDRVDVALALPQTGVHLRRSSLDPVSARRLLDRTGSVDGTPEPLQDGPPGPALPPPLRRSLGASVGTELPGADALASLDYVFLGTTFPTESHPAGTVAGPELVARIAAQCPVPALAIGGISRERIGVLVSAGLYGVAVIRSVWTHPDPVHAARDLLTGWRALGATNTDD